jgi:hypothetical protein
MSYGGVKGGFLSFLGNCINIIITYNLMGVGAGGQGVEPPVRVIEKLVKDVGGNKVRLG